MAIKMF